MAITVSNITVLSVPASTTYFTQYAGSVSDVRTLMSSLGNDFHNSSKPRGEIYTIWESDTMRIESGNGSEDSNQYLYIYDKVNNNRIQIMNNPNFRRIYVAFGFDDDLHLAYYFAVGTFYYNDNWEEQTYGVIGALPADKQRAYELISGNQIPEYNWQSVPSISGKNGTLSLVTLDSESINDGEPVSGAAVSVFDQNPVSGNNVKDIVDGNTPLIPSAVDVTAAFIISNPPVGELASRILAAKKGSIPESIEDADKTVPISANSSNVTMLDLDENSQYYFAIFVADAAGDTAVSDPKDIYTSADEGWIFDYTGEIQIFVAPKTGVYSLETWGAQGGDASDGTLTARGGYGAYAYGEVVLSQGDTLYINVGGQNGYGGGGKVVVTQNIQPSVCNTYFESTVDYDWLPYRDSAYCIWYGDVNKGRFVADGDKMTYYNSMVNSESHFWIPLQAHRHVKTIKFKYRKVRAGGDITYLWFRCLLQNRDDEGHLTDQVIVVDDLTGATTNEISVNYECDIIADYIHLMTCDGEVYVKDLQIIYETT